MSVPNVPLSIRRHVVADLDSHSHAVTFSGLACESAPEPDFEEHGVIVGWNPDPSAKDERLARQTDLAASVVATDVIRLP